MNVADQVSLRQRVIRAGLWSLAGFGLNYLIRFGSNLLMTRLLMPEMFGLMSIATTVMIGLTMFSDVGLKQFIVQHSRGNESAYLNTAWIVQILRGVLLWFLAVCLSLMIAVLARNGVFSQQSVYASPSLPPVIAVLSLSAVVSGFASTKLLEASRGLSLGSVTQIEIAAQFVGLISMILLSLVDRSVWVLVVGSLCSNLARAILSHLWLPGIANRWEWNSSAAREIVRVGKWIFVASILGFLVNSGDQLLLAGLVDSTTLGLYVVASLYVGSIDGVISKLMGDVSFPAFSEVVRERRGDLRRSYYQFHRIIAIIAYGSSGFLMAFGHSLIGLLYDPRYAAAGYMLQITAAILLTVPFRLATQTFLALGRPEIQSHVVSIRLASLVLFAPLGFHFYGLTGALVGIVFSHFSYIPLIVSYNLKHQLFDIRRELALVIVAPAGYAVGILCTIGLTNLR